MTIITLFSNIIYDVSFIAVLSSRFHGNNATFVLKMVEKSIRAGAAPIDNGVVISLCRTTNTL